jgi:hypothetical protein
VFTELENSPFSTWVRGDSLWGWPFVVTVHTLGTAVVIGLIFVITLRLLGLFETIPYTSLKRLFPVLWVAFALEFVTGVMLWATKPTRYSADGAFLLKVLFIIVGVVLTVYLYGAMKREAATWETAGAVSSDGVKFVAPTLLAWCVVLIFSRMTAMLGSI